MNSKSVAIIGSGISGLITGLKMVKEGMNVVIFEKNDDYGGVYKDSITFGYDNSFIYLNNINNDYHFDSYNFDYIYNSYLIKYIYYVNREKKEIYLYQDIIKMINQLIDYANNDSKNKEQDLKFIRRFKEDLEKALKYDFSLETDIKKLYERFGHISIYDYFKDFSFKEFNKLMDVYFGNDNSFVYFLNIYCLFIELKYRRIKNNKEFIYRIKKSFEELGGIIKYNSLIDKYDIGIKKFENEEKIRIKDEYYDYLIGCCDINHFYYLLGKGIKNRKIEYLNNNIDVLSLFSITYENDDNELNDGYLSFEIKDEDKFKVGAKVNDNFKIIKNGKIINISFRQRKLDYEYFSILKKNKKIYKEELLRIEKDVYSLLNRYLNLDGLKCIKIKSPVDFEDDFNIYKGGINGYQLVSEYLGIQFPVTTEIYKVFISSSWQRNPFFVNDCFINANKISDIIKNRK